MKRWNLKRHDQRHSTVLPSSRRCRARRLAFEHCEQRRMLSGASLTTEFVYSPNITLTAVEGGFLTVNTSGFLPTTANNFLLGADNFSEPLAGFALTDQWHFINTRQHLGASVANTPGNEAASSIAAPTLGPTLLDFDLSDTLLLEPLVPSTENSVTQDKEIIEVDDLHDNFSNDAPGLSGKTTKPLVIDDPIQIGDISRNADELELREGGALEVAAMVNTTQRAYETQLSAVIAHNLNRDGRLPTTAPTPARPVVAELARAVAFETLGQQQVIPTGEIDRINRSQFSEPLQATPATLEPVSAQRHVIPVRRTLAREVTSDEVPAHTSMAFSHGEETSSNFAERIEDEQHDTHAMNFARWPVLASVIAGYLFLERHSPLAAQTVQMPPRRNRQSPAS